MQVDITVELVHEKACLPAYVHKGYLGAICINCTYVCIPPGTWRSLVLGFKLKFDSRCGGIYHITEEHAKLGLTVRGGL